ncbi:hypothetical protein SDC9_64505 [bioreactor metagenome]|uniref:Uncharacterized protein n=1 Tax=bioreactor metagenome TaxID=1076179 RepID=A0A644XPM4_9ZZZZ
MKKHPNADMIPDKAIVTIYYNDGEVGTYGIVKGIDLLYLLRDWEYDKEFGMWFREKRDYAYDVKAI